MIQFSKYIFLIYLFSLGLNSFSQRKINTNPSNKAKQLLHVAQPSKPSLEQTCDWITQKLNNFSSTILNLIGTTSFTKRKFHIQNSLKEFVITYEMESKFPGPTMEIDQFRVSIPISQIDKVEYYESRIDLKNEDSARNTSLRIYTIKNILHYNITTNTASPYNFVEIPIDFTLEDSLFQKFKKAFNDLKSYFPKNRNLSTSPPMN